MRNIRDWVFQWALDLGQSPGASANTLQLFKMVALAKGLTSVAGWNELKTVRGIASTYGIAAGTFNELKCLRAIVGVLGVTPAGRNIADLNELDCLRAIVGGATSSHWVTGDGDTVVTDTGETIPV